MKLTKNYEQDFNLILNLCEQFRNLYGLHHSEILDNEINPILNS